MRYVVTGADANTGKDRSITIDAADAADAEARAQYSGLIVSRVQEEKPEAGTLDYANPTATPSLIDRLPHPMFPVGGGANSRRTFICPNPNCDYHGEAQPVSRGSVAVGLLLCLLMLLPGLIYFMFVCGTDYKCPRCGLKVNV